MRATHLGLAMVLASVGDALALPTCEPREGYSLPSAETMSRRWQQYQAEGRKVCIVGRLEASTDTKHAGIDHIVKEPFISVGNLELAPLSEELQDWILEHCKGQGTGPECVFAIYGTVVAYPYGSGSYALRPDQLVADPAAYR